MNISVVSRLMPGLGLLAIVSLLSAKLSELVVLGGKHPLEPTALAVLLGLFIRAMWKMPERVRPGIQTWEKFLIWGVVLIGASLNFYSFANHGLGILMVVFVTMAVSFFVIYSLGKLFNLPNSLSLLLTVGTTICGGSAIAITAPLIRAREEETSYAISTITLWGLLAILFYPKLGQFFQVSDTSFGIFAGPAIHSTPQVVGAGFIFSDEAGRIATGVKLIRNCFMAPLALLIAFIYRRASQETAEKINLKKAFPWFLFGFFLMAGLSTTQMLSAENIETSTALGKILILISMAGIGLSTDFAAFRSIGTRPLVVGLIGSVVVATVSVAMIAFIL